MFTRKCYGLHPKKLRELWTLQMILLAYARREIAKLLVFLFSMDFFLRQEPLDFISWALLSSFYNVVLTLLLNNCFSTCLKNWLKMHTWCNILQTKRILGNFMVPALNEQWKMLFKKTTPDKKNISKWNQNQIIYRKTIKFSLGKLKKLFAFCT